MRQIQIGGNFMTHKGTQEIRTKRLMLRRFAVADAQAMFDNWASDEHVTRYLTWEPHVSPEATAQLLADWTKAYSSPSHYNWVITLDGVPIGSIAVVRVSERSEWAELGYCLGRAFWGQGLMTEAASAVIAFLFDEVGVNRVAISHAVKNPASGRVAQKCGLTLEGTARAYFKSAAGEWLDIRTYSILREEFERARKGD